MAMNFRLVKFNCAIFTICSYAASTIYVIIFQIKGNLDRWLSVIYQLSMTFS